jgi:hypothetical protein
MANDESSTPYNLSELRRELDRYPIPILFGKPSTVDTYYTLEMLERGVGIQTTRHHSHETSLWYIGLRLLHDPILGIWDTPGDSVDGGVQKRGFLVQSSLVGLSVSSAKSAFDQLIRGNYSIAFAAIRHMLESSIQVMYLGVHPDQANRWTEEGTKTPGMKEMINELIGHGRLSLRATGEELNRNVFDSIYSAWDLMSKGSHPTGGGLSQVKPQTDEESHTVGAIYRPQLAYVGFDNGLFALKVLLDTMSMIRPTSEAWAAEVNEWGGKVGGWRRTLLDKTVLNQNIPTERRSEIERDIQLADENT